MSTTLRISADLALPIDAVTQAIAILARKGAGKTYTASVLVEEVIRVKVPVVVVDPTGGWWGLRSSVDGESAGLPVVIFGGDHGDVPLEPTAGHVIADVVVEHPGAYVLDLSAFPSKASEQRFAGDFLERLYRAKKRETGPLLLVVDEADVFAPQRPGPDQTRTLGALESIVRRGRIKGLGDLLITQRAAVLNKNVLTQTEVLIVMQTTGPQDRAAIDAWIEGNGTREERDEVLGSLASLQRGEAWVWSPSFLRILRRVHIRPRRTFDSSRTPAAGETSVAPRAFATVDLAQLGRRIADTVEQAKANDPAELRKRIRELEATAAKPAEKVVERIEVPVLNGQVDELRDVVRLLDGSVRQLGEVFAHVKDVGGSIIAAIDRVSADEVTAAPRSAPEQRLTTLAARGRSGAPRGEAIPRTRGIEPATSTDPARQAVAVAPSEPGDAPKLKAGARRMLSALAWFHPRPLTRPQLAMLTDISAISGTVSDYLSALRLNGLVAEEGQLVGLSDAGLALVADELGNAPPSTPELVEMWGRKVKAGARKMLQALVDDYPRPFSRPELAEVAGISNISGTTSDYLSALRRAGLLDESGDGIRANESLFLGGRS